MLKQILAAVAALTLAAPLAAQAQEVPSYASSAQADQQIQGRITGFDGEYNLAVLDDNGYTDNVQLHDGTVINPTGLSLAPGMVVNILGYSDGSVFDANEVDTPYTIDNAVPYYAGHPWNYYGPTIGLNFFFGNTSWWHTPRFRNGGFERVGVSFNAGQRRNNVTVNNFAQPVRSRAITPVFHAPSNTGFTNRGVTPHFVQSAQRNGGAAHATRSAPPEHERR